MWGASEGMIVLNPVHRTCKNAATTHNNNDDNNNNPLQVEVYQGLWDARGAAELWLLYRRKKSKKLPPPNKQDIEILP